MRRRGNRWTWIAAAVAMSLTMLATRGAPRALADVNCSDFSTQAAAQAFFLTNGGPALDPNRLDVDHDGIACESLPCPCNTSTTPTTTPTPTPSVTPPPTSTPIPTPIPTPRPTATPTPRPSLGRSVTLGRVIRNSHCRLHGPLPDPGCTPGARFSKITADEVCVSGYSSRVRNVSQSLKNAVYSEYGITKHFNGATGEVDH